MSYDYDRRASDERLGDTASNRVRNTRQFVTSAARDLKKAEQVLAGVQREFELYAKHDRAKKALLGELTDVTSHVMDLRKKTEVLTKNIEDLSRRIK
jgi:ABC-type transporter Mla subunit MlaD